MKRNYRKYTDEDIIEFSKTVKSIAGLLKKLGLKTVGGNYDNIKRKLQKLKVDTSHWTGKAWNRAQQLKDYSQYSRGARLRPHLIRERGNQCECCKLTHWLELPIKIEVHHIDGVRGNNAKENLQLLCPNCHSFTSNFRGRIVTK